MARKSMFLLQVLGNATFAVANNTKEAAALQIYVKTAGIARTNMNGDSRNSE
jgi:hypothetical protein